MNMNLIRVVRVDSRPHLAADSHPLSVKTQAANFAKEHELIRAVRVDSRPHLGC
jgi:hypothetical protein